MRRLPEWWGWEFEISPHLLRRMEERDFTETDLRRMLHGVRTVRPDASTGRYRARGYHRNHEWMIVLEPDHETGIVVVIAAFRIVLKALGAAPVTRSDRAPLHAA